MAILLKIKNPPLPNEEESSLTAASSGTNHTVDNNEGWGQNDVIVAEDPGTERSEARIVSSVSGNDTIVTSAAFRFSHPIGTPLYKTRYDQISIERQVNGSGAYSEIVEGKINIEWDEKDGYTKVLNQAGSTADNFKWRFYNSASGEFSAYSGVLPGTGLTSAYAGKMVKAVRKYGKIPANLGITDLEILDYLNEGQKELDAEEEKWWFCLTEDTDATRVTAIAGTFKYDVTNDFRSMDVVKVLDTSSIKYPLSFSPLIEFDSLKADTSTSNRSDSTKNWTLLPPDSSNKLGYFGVHPTPLTTGIYFYRRYYRFIPELTSFASQTIVPLPRVLVAYAIWQIYLLREDPDNGRIWENRYKDGVQKLRQMQRRQVGQAEFQRFRGQRGYSRLFGNYGYASRDYLHENYW